MNKLVKIAGFVAATLIMGCVSAPQNSSQLGTTGMQPAEAVVSQMPSTGMATSGAATEMIGNVASSSASAQTPSLVNILVQQLGVTPQQATGGAGSIFSLAKQSLSPTSFGQISNAVPGMDQLIAAAPVLAGTSGGNGLMGSAASALGGSSMGNLLGLVNAFQSLGMGSGMMNQFIPIILQYLQDTGGSTTMGLLQNVLMP